MERDVAGENLDPLVDARLEFDGVRNQVGVLVVVASVSATPVSASTVPAVRERRVVVVVLVWWVQQRVAQMDDAAFPYRRR